MASPLAFLASGLEYEQSRATRSLPGSRSGTPLVPMPQRPVLTPTSAAFWKKKRTAVVSRRGSGNVELVVAAATGESPTHAESPESPTGGTGAVAAAVPEPPTPAIGPPPPPRLVFDPLLLAKQTLFVKWGQGVVGKVLGADKFDCSEVKPPNSDWILPGLLLGGYPMALARNNRANLTHVVKVCDMDHTARGWVINPALVPTITDLPMPTGNILGNLEAYCGGDLRPLLLELIQSLAGGSKMYVHCVNGETRSGCLVGYLVMYLFDVPPEHALTFITKCHAKTDQYILSDLAEFYAKYCGRK